MDLYLCELMLDLVCCIRYCTEVLFSMTNYQSWGELADILLIYVSAKSQEGATPPSSLYVYLSRSSVVACVAYRTTSEEGCTNSGNASDVFLTTALS